MGEPKRPVGMFSHVRPNSVMSSAFELASLVISWFCVLGLQVPRDEPIHILNVAIKTDCDIEDDRLAAMFREFTQQNVSPQMDASWPWHFSLPSASHPSFCQLLLTQFVSVPGCIFNHSCQNCS